MPRNLAIYSVVLLSLIGFAAPASATTIVINPNDFPLGTDLSAMFEGVTLARLDNRDNRDGINGRPVYDPIASAVYAIPTYHTRSGLSIGGISTQANEYEWCRTTLGGLPDCAHYNVLELLFDEPTDFVQVDSIAWSDYPVFYAYDIFGNRIDTFGNQHLFAGYGNVTHATPGGDYIQTVTSLSFDHALGVSLTAARNQRDIARVVFGGIAGATSATQVTYRVPEAETLGLLAIGILFALAFRGTMR